ncbi:pyridoxamine 5'-phosphate oxidase family protein [Saccharopolyspora rosea]|uniref:Pyridoxamine 5'-phosphate oxidase family protein n=1 Tax=Saccharopolyspora rosea TaxID=524884 RepID=A0ABW3FI98_9PSEU|nr:pyridoxamine 5'-phosphate oxidase family protein [Saccharopolyspora rosea]
MATWEKFATEAPDLAGVVRERFQAFRHHVLATVRHDGSPRVSGTEVSWWGADLVIGSMPSARKALDLRRDGRFALHVNPGDGSMEGGGDVKISGRAVEVVGAEQRAWVEEVRPPSPDSHLFRLDLTEAVTTAVSDDQTHLVITLWRPAEGIRTFHRA